MKQSMGRVVLGLTLALGGVGSVLAYTPNAQQQAVIDKAALGDVAAITELGYMHSRGAGVPYDLERAEELLTQAIELGDPNAKAYLGFILMESFPGYDNDQKARGLFKASAAEGNMLGVWGEQYYLTIGDIEANKKENIALLRQQEEVILKEGTEYMADFIGSFNPSWIYIPSGPLLTKAAEAGNANALNSLGVAYLNGIVGNGEGLPKAIEYYTQAAELGSSFAMQNLGATYFEGAEIRQDLTLAKKYFEEAASLNNLDAFNSLGWLYQNGFGVKQNYQKAKELYGYACDNGNFTGCDYYKELNQAGH